MPYRTTPLVNGEIYHIFNRGVEKRNIFTDKRDHARFLETLIYYRQANRSIKFSQATLGKKGEVSDKNLIEIISYCLMPNHFHFLLKQLKENGISTFVSLLTNSYTRYFNTKNERIGPLFQGPFKAVRIESDEQLLHVTRYIHLNPVIGHLVRNPQEYKWSSYLDYLGLCMDRICKREIIEQVISLKNYKQFVLDQVDYAKQISKLKYLMLDAED